MSYHSDKRSLFFYNAYTSLYLFTSYNLQKISECPDFIGGLDSQIIILLMGIVPACIHSIIQAALYI